MMFGLAKEWHEAGHAVTVFTLTPGEEQYDFTVIRSLSSWKLWKAVRESDACIEANISLKTWWVGVLNRKKWFVTHQLTYTHHRSWNGKLKNYLTFFSRNIAASDYVAGTLKGKSIVIPNFYSSNFFRDEAIKKNKDVVFVGRLVSDKGAHDLVKALAILKSKSLNIGCTIIGSGPEEGSLRKLIADLQLNTFVSIRGALKGTQLVEEINAHRVMVVPSRWPEPFGIVALEGLACGCRIVCSSAGGLPEAVNGFGLLYKNNDVDALADCIMKAIEAPVYSADEFSIIQSYLFTRTTTAISKRYLDFFINKHYES